MDKWKDEVEETRNEMKEGGELPSDLQEQMDEFLPVSLNYAYNYSYKVVIIITCYNRRPIVFLLSCIRS